MIEAFSKLYWRINKWKITGSLPKEHKKMILVVAPHTSWIDILIGFAVRDKLNIPHAKFLGKKELFEAFYGKWLLRLGGIPVDRSAKLGVVEQVVKYYDEKDKFILGISPEGTRNRVNTLKTGFYHIAKATSIPIILVGFDFKNKQVILGDPIYTSENEAADFKKILKFFSTIQGANPKKDLTHLQK